MIMAQLMGNKKELLARTLEKYSIIINSKNQIRKTTV
jgi:hypothetical protein